MSEKSGNGRRFSGHPKVFSLNGIERKEIENKLFLLIFFLRIKFVRSECSERAGGQGFGEKIRISLEIPA